MRGTVKKWGNSAAIRVPIAVMQEVQLEIDQAIDIRAEGGRIIIEPLPAFDLEEMLARVTDENLHEEASLGAPAGKEAL